MEYGKDPNLRTPKRTWELSLSQSERKLIDCLSDFILPVPNEFMQPSKMNISIFFDEWVSAPYDDQQSDRSIILKGLKLLELESEKKYNISFCNLLDDQKKVVLESLISSTNSINDGVVFFNKFRYLLIGGYYTSDIGFKAIGYIGNVPLNNFPAASIEAQEKIESELVRLGLPSYN